MADVASKFGFGGILGVRPKLPVGLGYTTGKYYGPSMQGVSQNSTANITQDRDYFMPFLCRQSKTFDRIAFYNTGAVTVNTRMAIYADDGGGHPGTLLVDSGVVATSGAAGDNIATISQALVYGTMYWFAFNCATTLACVALQAGALAANWDNAADFAMPTAVSGVNYGCVGFAGRAFAAFPSTATAISAYDAAAPLVRIRAA